MSHAAKIEAFLRTVTIRARVVHLKQIVHGVKDDSSIVEDYPLQDIDPRELAKQIDREARADATDSGLRVCRYALDARDADDAHVKRVTFRVLSEDTSGQVGPEEPPTAAGQIAQSMRLVDAVIMRCFAKMDACDQSLLRENERLSEQNDKLQARHFEMLSTHEKLQSEQAERELAAEEQRARTKYRDKVITSVIEPLAPRLVHRLLEKYMPEDAQTARIKRFFKNVENDQLAQLFESPILRADQKEEIADLLQSLNDLEKPTTAKSAPAAGVQPNAET